MTYTSYSEYLMHARDTPDENGGYLEHYGRLGMKWYQHKFGEADGRSKYFEKGQAKAAKLKEKAAKLHQKYETTSAKSNMLRAQADVTGYDPRARAQKKTKKLRIKSLKLAKKANKSLKKCLRAEKKAAKILRKIDKLSKVPQSTIDNGKSAVDNYLKKAS